MTDSAFNKSLDALVRGESAAGSDDLTTFAADLYRRELGVTMPAGMKSAIGARLGLDTRAVPASAAPISRRTTRATSNELDYARRPWSIAAAIVIAISLALTGILQWGMQTGEDGDDNRFGVLSPAIPTVEATPSATRAPARQQITAGEEDGQNWLIPITAEDCQENALQATPVGLNAETYVAMPARVDEPYQPVMLGEGDDIIEDARAIRGCGELWRSSAFTTGRFQYENFDNQFVVSDEYHQLLAERITRGRSLSAFYQQNMGVKPGSGNLAMPGNIDWLDGYEPGTHPVILPTSLVQLADGRVVLLVTAVTIPQPGEIVAAVPEPTTSLNAWVMVEEEGKWLLDELLPVCFGDCSQFWVIQPGAIRTATPVDSPTSVPMSGDRPGSFTTTPLG